MKVRIWGNAGVPQELLAVVGAVEQRDAASRRVL
jgi:hypothetical protein